jgi:hypothetical protein
VMIDLVQLSTVYGSAYELITGYLVGLGFFIPLTWDMHNSYAGLVEVCVEVIYGSY